MPASALDPVRFASINIEGDKHLDGVVSFLKNFKPDVVCFQELTIPKIEFFEGALAMKGPFLSISKTNVLPGNTASPIAPEGVAIYSTLPISNVRSEYYYGGTGDLPTLVLGNEESLWRGILQATVEKDGQFYTIATTHFTRTPDGSTSDKQREDLKNMLKLLDGTPEMILCGDFNAPRGGEIFTKLAEKYKDNIPPQYFSSLDPKLHRAGHLKLMVDGLFSTSQYQISDVKLSDGVSDHRAITALISKLI